MTEPEAGGRSGAFARSLGILPEMALIGCGAALLMGLLLTAAARQNDTARAAAVQVAEAMLRREMAELTSRVGDVAWWRGDAADDAAVLGAGRDVQEAVRQLTERYNVDEALIFPQSGDGPANAGRPWHDGRALQ
ncbi:MAG TPA: hypothetical protein PKZ97_08105, partial [Azospirillaceae bacterium]|nr:hypothetical protein [Azospirillaceae bacterium]